MDDCEAMCDLRKFHWGDRCCSVTKSCSTLCDPMDWLSRFLCPLLSPDIRSHSCPLSQWWHLTISSSAAPFSFRLQSFPASGSLTPLRWWWRSNANELKNKQDVKDSTSECGISQLYKSFSVMEETQNWIVRDIGFFFFFFREKS